MGRIYENDLHESNITNDIEILLEEGDFIIPNDNPCHVYVWSIIVVVKILSL